MKGTRLLRNNRNLKMLLLGLVALGATAIGITLYATGVLDSLGRILQNAGFGPQPGKGTFQFNGAWIFERLFLIGLLGVVVWSLVNLLVAVLYNLVSDVVGGVSVTLTEKR